MSTHSPLTMNGSGPCLLNSSTAPRGPHVIDALGTFVGNGSRRSAAPPSPLANATTINAANVNPSNSGLNQPPQVMSLNELLEVHNDPQLDARLPPENPNRPVIRHQREILYGKWNIGPSRADRLAAKIRHKFGPTARKRRKAIREDEKKKALEEQPPKYMLTDFHHQLVQEMRVVIENQEAVLEQLTNLLYQKDAEIEKMHYDMMLVSTPPNGTLASIREEPVRRFGGGCRE